MKTQKYNKDMKKAYIAPSVESLEVELAKSVLVPLSGGGEGGPGVAEVEEENDWDIWNTNKKNNEY